MNEGWHIRVPVAVSNPSTLALEDATVGHDVLLGEALLAGGWVTSRQGSVDRLGSFHLDESSLRVVEYSNLSTGGALAAAPLADVEARMRSGALAQTRAFDARAQPDLHVEWKVPGRIAPGETRYFMIYVDTQANGMKGTPNLTERDLGEIGGRHWISRGTTLYGMAGRLTLVAPEKDTEVLVEIYTPGGWFPAEFLDPTLTNPILIGPATTTAIDIADKPRLLRIRADRAVMAVGTGISDVVGVGGPVPAADGGGLLGKRFHLPNVGAGYLVHSPIASATLTFDERPPIRLGPDGIVAIQAAEAGTPGVHDRPVHTLVSTAPVLVTAWPTSAKQQLTTPWGAPVGARLVGLPYEGHVCVSGTNPDGGARRCNQGTPPCTIADLGFRAGELTVATLDPRTNVRGRDLQTGEATQPRTVNGRVSTTARPIALGIPARMETIVPLPRVACPISVEATASAVDEAVVEGASLVAFGGRTAPGPEEPIMTPIGGKDAMDFVILDSASAIALYDATELRVTRGGTTSSHGLGASVALPLNASFDAPAVLHATKPILVVPQRTGGYFAGEDDTLVVSSIGPAQYRGYLVGLRPAGGASEPMVGVGSPGRAATYSLEVSNLAKDQFGRPVADDITLTVDATPAGWRAELSTERVHLEGGANATVELRVTPPPDTTRTAPVRLALEARSAGNPQMKDRVSVVTIIRPFYKLDLWFEKEGGVKSRSLAFDPGESMNVSVVVKNLAVIPDRIALTADAFDPAWQIVAGSSKSGGILEVPLDAGESTTVRLNITAPVANASTSLLEVSATSLSDASAAAKVAANARIRVATKLALTANETAVEGVSGGSVRLRFHLENRGDDILAAKFNASGVLPAGWGAPAVLRGEYPLAELSGVRPHSRVALDLVVPIPADARRTDRAILRIEAETLPQAVGDAVVREGLDVLVLVAAKHDLEVRGPGRELDAMPLGEVEVLLDVRNAGNGAESLRLALSELPPRVSMLPDPDLVVESPGAGTFRVRFAIPGDLAPGLYSIPIDLVAEDGHKVSETVDLRVPERPAATILLRDPPTVIPGRSALLNVEIGNDGNVPLALPPLFLAPSGWTIHATAHEGTLPPGTVTFSEVAVLAPREAEGGPEEIAFAPSWGGGRALSLDVRTVELRASLVATAPEVVVEITNAGTADAASVPISLRSGERTLDTVTLPRVPAGGSATVILGRSAAAGELSLVVDESMVYSADAVTLPVPPLARDNVALPPPALALLAISFIALVRERARR